MKTMLANKYYLMDCDELLSYTKQDYWPKSSYLNYFEEPYIPPLREDLYVEEITFLEDYVQVKEQNIEISKEINEGVVMEDPKIKIIVEENNEDPILEKDMEVEMVETIKEEIEQESFEDLNEMKSYDYQFQDPFILVVSDTSKFINFIRVDRFDSIASSYLVNLYNCMKTKEKEIPINLFILLMSCKYGNKIKGLKYSKYLFAWHGRFQISKMNSRMSLLQVERSNVGQKLLFNLCNLLISVFNL